MKIFIHTILLTLFLCSTLDAQPRMEWSESEQIAVGTGAISPILDLFDDGTPALIWGVGNQIFFSKHILGKFNTPIQISTAGLSPSIYSFGGLDLAIQQDNVYVVFETFGQGLFLLKSSDGGITFGPPISIYAAPTGHWNTLASITINEDGHILVSSIFETQSETKGTIQLSRSLDGGTTFLPPVLVNGSANGNYVCECCPPDVYTSENDIWIIFRNNDENLRDMWIAKSSTNGDTFDIAVDVDDTDWVLNACPISGPKLTSLSGDSLISVWASGAQGGLKIWASTVDGNTMQKGAEIQIPQTNANALQSNPNIAGKNDTIGIAWQESGFGINGTDILFSLSLDGSAEITQDITNLSESIGLQSYPSLKYMKGAFHLAYRAGAGIIYRKGKVVNVSGISEPTINSLCFSVIEQPIRNHNIRLRSNCLESATVVEITLFNLQGKVMQRWPSSTMTVGNEIDLQLTTDIKGSHFIEVRTQHEKWLNKVLVL